MTSLPATLAVRASQTIAEFRCAACGSTHSALGVTCKATAERPFELWTCGDCGLVQQHPRAMVAPVRAEYEEDYYVFAESPAHRWARALQQYVVHLSSFEGKPGRLLEIGCALGHFCALARERGWRVTGLDISAHAVSRAAVDFGLDVRAGTLARHRETLGPCDVIFLGDCLEHVSDPAALLRDVGKLLVPGGMVCIDTPNWGGRWRRFGGASWLGLNRFHVNLFDAVSAGRLLAACGFQDVRIGSYTHYRYESLAQRPETQRWVRYLPGFAKWRLNRIFERMAARSSWSALRTKPPASLAETVQTTRQFAAYDTSSLTHDNLAIAARR